MKLLIILSSAALGSFTLAAPAAAATTVDCHDYLGLVGGATACYGFVDGNVLDNSSSAQNPDVQTQTTALAALGATFTDFNNYLKIDDTGGTSSLTFGTPLLGNTIIGIHFGNGSEVGNSTGFFQFNFATPTTNIPLGISSSSGAVLYTTQVGSVPEPATWALMLVGFAGIGLATRRSRRPALTQIA